MFTCWKKTFPERQDSDLILRQKMARLINPSLCFFCARCSQSRGCFSSKLACRVNVEYQPVTGKFQQRRTLTHARRISQFYNGTRKRIWGLGFGAGLLIALGFKNYCDNNERCDCEAETPGQINSVSKYRTAIEISRDLLQRVKVPVPSPRQYFKLHGWECTFIPECIFSKCTS